MKPDSLNERFEKTIGQSICREDYHRKAFEYLAPFARGVTFADQAPEPTAYLASALFDPYVVQTQPEPVAVSLGRALGRLDELDGIEVREVRPPLREYVRWESPHVGTRRFVNEYPWAAVEAGAPWAPLATIAELPALLARPGHVVFTCDILALLDRYRDERDLTIAGDTIALIVNGILAARGAEPVADPSSLRRDFHALGCSAFLVAEFYCWMDATPDFTELWPVLEQATRHYTSGDAEATRLALGQAFGLLLAMRERLLDVPIYIINMPHGGILFPHEGYAEYDWPEAAARDLLFYLGLAEEFGYAFAPDVGAGSLENLARTHPETIARLREAWDRGLIEFVNGTYSQPYLQEYDEWDQRKQFETGLETFERLFGRRPTVYASQEAGLHPMLPSILKDYGYTHAIHQIQNLGTAPVDESPLIEWTAPDGKGVTTLAEQPHMSVKHGHQIYRNMPALLYVTARANLPFAAITSMIDQSMVGKFKEEVIRTSAYAPVWGRFVTPTQFFEAEAARHERPARTYRLDDYEYFLEIVPHNAHHRFESGGHATQHAFWYPVSTRLREKEAAGTLTREEIIGLLEGEAHDCHMVAHFKQGAFLEFLQWEYAGPRYRVHTSRPFGVTHFIGDSVGFDPYFSERPPAEPDSRAEIDGDGLRLDGGSCAFDPVSGAVTAINGRPVALGMVRYRNMTLHRTFRWARGGEVCYTGELGRLGAVRVRYFIRDGRLYGTVSWESAPWEFDYCQSYWEDCVVLEHGLDAGSEVVRHSSGLHEPTGKARFHSVRELTLTAGGAARRLGFGGAIFFRREGDALHQRLWAYNETCRAFWWSVDL